MNHLGTFHDQLFHSNPNFLPSTPSSVAALKDKATNLPMFKKTQVHRIHLELAAAIDSSSKPHSRIHDPGAKFTREMPTIPSSAPVYPGCRTYAYGPDVTRRCAGRNSRLELYMYPSVRELTTRRRPPQQANATPTTNDGVIKASCA